MSLRKKIIIASVLLLLSFLAAIPFAITELGGNFEEESNIRNLSPGADFLLRKVYAGLDPYLLRDYHAHIAGIGTGNSGCYVNSKMTSPVHPLENLKFRIYKSAAGIKSYDHADQDFLQRLISLMKNNQ